MIGVANGDNPLVADVTDDTRSPPSKLRVRTISRMETRRGMRASGWGRLLVMNSRMMDCLSWTESCLSASCFHSLGISSSCPAARPHIVMSFLNGISASPTRWDESIFWPSSSTVVGTDDDKGVEVDASSFSARTKAAR